MAKLEIKAGTTSKLVDIFIQDSSSTTGAGLTGLTNASSGLTWYFYREGDATSTQVTSIASMTLGTWVTKGFIVIDGTNMPGCYQLGVPDAAIAAGAKSVIMLLKGVTNMAPLVLEIELTAVDNQDAVRYGLTALPNAAAAASGGLPTIGATIPNATAGAAGGIFIAGTNAATTVTTSFTTTFTGNLTGSVASVTGAVGSVTSGVTVTTNNDKTGYSLTQSFPTNFSSLSIDASGRMDTGKWLGTAVTAAQNVKATIVPLGYQGDFVQSLAVAFSFLSLANGVPTALLGSPVVTIIDGSGVAVGTAVLTVNIGSVTGLNNVLIDTSPLVGDYTLYMSAGTVGGITVVGQAVATFSVSTVTNIRRNSGAPFFIWGADTASATSGGPGTMGYDIETPIASMPTANQNADALLDRSNAIEVGLTPRQLWRLEGAALAGKMSGGATTTNTFRNAVADSKNRIVATVDSSGNRTAITTDVT